MAGLTPEFIAREIIRPEVDAQRVSLCGEIVPQMWQSWEVMEPIERIAKKMADAFARENPGFNRSEWNRACGFEE